jgi:hypothetical protein
MAQVPDTGLNKKIVSSEALGKEVDALEEDLAAGQPALIEVAIEPGIETSPWHLIHMRTRPSQTPW